MKKHILAALTIAAVLFLTACGSKTQSVSSENIESAVTVSEPVVKHENPRVDYTKDEVREMLEKSPNLKVCNDYFYASVPKTIDHLSEFYSGTAYQLPPEKELEEFKKIFRYLFPDHEFDDNCLYAYAVLNNTNPEEKDIFKTRFHSLKNEDNYEAYMNGTLGVPEKTRYLLYTEEQYPRENSVSLYYRSPFGNDYCVFNKGVCNKFSANLRGEKEYYAYEQFRLGSPEFGFEFVGSYPPDSELKFKLLDKEISIKDAVSFFESYIASIPLPEEPVFGIHVNTVSVYKLDDEHYGFEFINSRIYDGIHFNYVWDGCDTDGLNRDMSYGIMVKSDDVDHVYAPFNAYKAYDEVQHTDFIPFEEAVEMISEKMTNYVGFEVTRAELIFREKTNENENGGVGEILRKSYPSWKLTMQNPNDNLTYVAYVNALTGEFQGGR